MLPKSDGAGVVGVLFASAVGVPAAAPKALLPKIEDESALAASAPKIFAGDDCATGFVSGEQMIKSLRTESVLGGEAGGVAMDETVAAGFDRSKPMALLVGAIVDAALANENLWGLDR